LVLTFVAAAWLIWATAMQHCNSANSRDSTGSNDCNLLRIAPCPWEGDLIGGSRDRYVATFVERHSRYVMLVKVAKGY
jgi:hypothetical protein